jgi:hypothetical protein
MATMAAAPAMAKSSSVSGTVTTDEKMKEIIQGPGDIEWRYEMRRECQEILPGLWLGPFLVSKSLETLQSLAITHMCALSLLHWRLCSLRRSTVSAYATRKRLSPSSLGSQISFIT